MSGNDFDAWVDEALRARAAAVAPPEFTRDVMQRVALDSERAVRVPRWLAQLSEFCNPVAAGIALAVVGSGVVLSTTGVLALGESLAAPAPLFAAGTALVISGVYWSRSTET